MAQELAGLDSDNLALCLGIAEGKRLSDPEFRFFWSLVVRLLLAECLRQGIDIPDYYFAAYRREE